MATSLESTIALAVLVLAMPCVPAAVNAATLAPSSICVQPSWSADGDQLDCRFGTVAPAGDVNGDGYADVLVGSYNYDHPEIDEGRVFLYLGGPSGLALTPAWTAESNQASAHFGDKLSTAGDVNGDGFDDVINGAGDYDGGQLDEGRAYLHLGSATGPSLLPDWIREIDQAGARYGSCVQSAGDVNHDGFGDVIVGAWLYDHGETDEGGAWVYLGSDSGLSDTPVWSGESNSTGAIYGYFCTRAGDLNGDGYEDIVVGARRFSGNGLSKEGRVYVYNGSPTGPAPTPSWTLDGGQKGGELGTSPAPAGDVNGDGFDDLLVNAPRYDHPNVDEGKVWLYMGSPTGLGTTPAWTAEGDQDSAQFGYHLDGAGDVNGDGFDDVIVSAPWLDANGFHAAGSVFLYLGSASGLSPMPAWVQRGDQFHGELGHAARGVGDVNGDGRADITTGAIYRDGAFENSGRAYLFYGCPDGVASVPRAEAGVALAAGPNPFRESARLDWTTPAGERVRLEIHDLGGRLVTTLVDGVGQPGHHTATWNARTASGARTAAGVYLARLVTARGARSIKLVLLP